MDLTCQFIVAVLQQPLLAVYRSYYSGLSCWLSAPIMEKSQTSQVLFVSQIVIIR